jgi:hypothetical protein
MGRAAPDLEAKVTTVGGVSRERSQLREFHSKGELVPDRIRDPFGIRQGRKDGRHGT